MSSFTDTGLIIRTRPHGEGAMILTALSEHHGVRSGYVHAGRLSKSLRGVLQPGNFVHLDWQGSGEDGLGRFSVEEEWNLLPHILDDRMRLLAVQSVCALIDQCVGEREPHPGLYDGTKILMQMIEGQDWPPVLIMWEIQLLKTLGFALNLDRCVSSGVAEGLAYVSPKSGGAVSLAEGEPYAHKLLPLPPFLAGGDDWQDDDIADGLKMTGYFLFHRVLDPLSRAMPEAREQLYRCFLPESDEQDIQKG